jgi:PAS domain S-box-containing protein
MVAETLLQVLELFPGPALIVESGGQVVGFNDRMERWIGLTRDELNGRSLAQLVAESPERVAGFLEDCARGGRKVAGILAPSRGDGAGSGCRVEGISVQTRTDEGEPPLVVIHVNPDEPGADAVATSQEGALEALQEEMRRKDEFLGRLAHDLRNPVAAISGALSLARRATSPEDLAWAEDAIERQLKYLVRQIDDLLVFSRITRGKSEGLAKGSAFTARLPVAADSSEPVVEKQPSAPAGARVLIVDDNVDTASGMAKLLELAGHAVQVAHDGRQALEIVRSFRPRFVLLDIVLPSMDGYEVARQIRSDPSHRDTTIIAISGYGAEEVRCRSQGAEFDHHLVKPIDYNALRAIIDASAAS